VPLSVASVVRGPGEIAAMVVDVTKGVFTTRFQTREFIEQAWFITSVTLMPTILVSIPFGAVIALQVGNLTGQLGAQSFAGASAVLAVVREAAPIAAALIIAGAAGSAICSDLKSIVVRSWQPRKKTTKASTMSPASCRRRPHSSNGPAPIRPMHSAPAGCGSTR